MNLNLLPLYLYLATLALATVAATELTPDNLDIPFMSKLRYEIRSSHGPILTQCAQFWRGLSESLEAKTTDNGSDSQDERLLLDQVDTSLLVKASELLKNKTWAFDNKNLIVYLDDCMKRLNDYKQSDKTNIAEQPEVKSVVAQPIVEQPPIDSQLLLANQNNKQLSANIEELKRRIVDLEAKELALNGELSAQKEQVRKVETNRDELQNKVARLGQASSASAELKAQLEAKDETIRSLEAKIAANKQELENKIVGFESSDESLKAELASRNGQVSHLEADKSELQKRIAGLETIELSIKAELAAKDEKIQSLETEIGANRKELDNCRQDAMKSRISGESSLKIEMAEKDERIHFLESKIDANKSELDNCRQDSKRAMNVCRNVDKIKTDCLVEAQKLKADLQVKNHEVARSNIELRKEQTSMSRCTENLRVVIKERSQAIGEVKKFKEKLSDTEKRAKKCEDELELFKPKQQARTAYHVPVQRVYGLGGGVYRGNYGGCYGHSCYDR